MADPWAYHKGPHEVPLSLPTWPLVRHPPPPAPHVGAKPSPGIPKLADPWKKGWVFHIEWNKN